MVMKFANNAQSTLASSITAGATSCAVASGDGAKFPALGAGDWCHVTLAKIVGGAEQREIVKVTARSGDAITAMVRAQEGTTALSFNAGDKVELRPTAAGFDAKLDKAGGTLSGDVDAAGNKVKNATGQGGAEAFYDSGTSGALDYANGRHQRWAPNTGAQSLSVANWPASGKSASLMIEGVNLGAATITTAFTVNWVKPDGTFAANTSLNTNHGATLQSAGTDFVILWTRNGGATVYGKVVR